MSRKPTIERARPGDLQGVLAILNHYIETHHCTFDTEPWSVADKQGWFDNLGGESPHRLLVARVDGTIAGYAHSGQFRPKAGYSTTAETTVYVDPGCQNLGLGHALLSALLDELSGAGLHRAIAIIAQPNEASNRLHERLGFRAIGTFTEVGHKFGRYWDSTWYECAI